MGLLGKDSANFAHCGLPEFTEGTRFFFSSHEGGAVPIFTARSISIPYYLSRVAWSILDCARPSHPPTHWQIFFTRPTLRLLRNRFPVTCQLPWRGPSNFLCLSWREWPRLPFTARIERAQHYRARSASKKGTWPLPPHPFSGRAFREQGDRPIHPHHSFSASC